MTSRVHVLALVGLVALIVGFGDSGKVWAQGPPVVTGCRSAATGTLETNDLGVSTNWTLTVTGGTGTTDDPDAGPHTAGGSIKITVAVNASVNGGAVITQTITLRDTYNFNGKTVVGPGSMTKSGKTSIGKNALRSRWARAAGGGVHANKVQLEDPSTDTFTVTITVTHSAGPLVNPPETGSPVTLSAQAVEPLPAATGELQQISINLMTPLN